VNWTPALLNERYNSPFGEDPKGAVAV